MLDKRVAAALLAVGMLLAPARAADAFCGFYVAGADTKLYNNATMVVMMRQGTRTVLAMQNNYQGPPAGFAMVVPVPVVLQKENVKTLDNAVFDHVDKLAAPRLVEYWEQDPCPEEPDWSDEEGEGMAYAADAAKEPSGAAYYRPKVVVEAQFVVGEYEIVILSASDSAALDAWIRENGFAIPPGAEPYLRPYVAQGSKFFVAKVDPTKVRFENGQAMLSPLRFHYDAETFNLPIRLGLINSSGTQDLIVHILAQQRYQVANYDNVTIPTNIDVNDQVRQRFGSFFAALFDRTLALHPRAVITEYAWDSGSCDPCPTPPLEPQELAILGADVLPEQSYSFTLTRLHARYSRESLGEDLVFKEAPAIVGGREFVVQDGVLETGAREEPGGYNNFQARYAIRHPWTGPIECASPRRGVWGGPPDGGEPQAVMAAQKLAFVPREGVALASVVQHDVPELQLAAAKPSVAGAGQVPKLAPGAGGCACRVAEGTGDGRGLYALAIAALLAAARRRR